MRKYNYLLSAVDSNYMEHQYTYCIKDNNIWVDEDLFLSHLRFLLIINFFFSEPSFKGTFVFNLFKVWNLFDVA